MNPPPFDSLNAIKNWLTEAEAVPLPQPQPQGLSAQERQELKKVERAMAQLAELGFPIPPEMTAKQKQLAERVVPEAPEPEVSLMLPELERLCDDLSGISKRARTLRDRVRTTATANGPRRHYPVSPFDLLEADLLSTEDRLELQWSRESDIYEGRLEADGSIRANTQDGWMQFRSLSTAAQHISGRPQNGWQHWRRVNDDGSKTPLEAIRDQYLRERGQL